MSVPVPIEVDLQALAGLSAAEQAEELAKVQVLQRVLAENPQWRYLPHEGELQWKREAGEPVSGSESRGQVEFHERSALGTFIVAAVAGNRFGKTHVGVEDALIQTLPREFLPPWLLPFKFLDPADREVFWRFVGVDLANWLAKAMLPKCRKLIPRAALWKGDFDKAWNDRERKLRFADGSWWDFLTHDMELDSFASADLDGITYDEEPPGTLGAQQWEEGLGRLVDRAGVIRCTLTPLLGLSWLYRELSENDRPRRDDEVWVVTGSIDHNPHLSEKGRERVVRRWEKKDPLRAQARRHGQWVHFEGLIFPDFDRDRHVVPDRPVPRVNDEDPLSPAAVSVYAGIDPGMAEDHPAALLFAWVNPDDLSIEVFHTHRLYQGTVGEMAGHYHDTLAVHGVRPRWNVIDPSARNKNHQTGRSVQDEYRKHRIYTVPGQNSRLASYNAITELLKTGRLRVHSSCMDLVEEIENYRWRRPRRQGEDAPRQEPIKIRDDLIDALRYLVMSLPQAKPVKVEEEPLGSAEQAVRDHLKRVARGGRRRRIGGAI